MSHTDRRFVFKEKVKDILALSPVLLGVPTKILSVQSNCLNFNEMPHLVPCTKGGVSDRTTRPIFGKHSNEAWVWPIKSNN